MQSNDARLLLHAVVPTLAIGAVAVAVSGAVAGVTGALGAVIGTVLVLLVMGAASSSCKRPRRTTRSCSR